MDATKRKPLFTLLIGMAAIISVSSYTPSQAEVLHNQEALMATISSLPKKNVLEVGWFFRFIVFSIQWGLTFMLSAIVLSNGSGRVYWEVYYGVFVLIFACIGTLGIIKGLFGMKTVDANYKEISMPMLFTREVYKLFTLLINCVGIFIGDRRLLHDQIFDTRVVYRSKLDALIMGRLLIESYQNQKPNP